MFDVTANSWKKWESHGRPYTPFRALLGGSGVAQPGQSEQIGDLDGERLLSATLLNLGCPDMYAAQVTIILGRPTLLQTLAVGGEQNTPPLVARLSFGVGGTQTDLEVDWIAGQLFSVPASWLRLDAALDFDQFTDVPAVDEMPRVNVPAMIGHLPVGQNRAPQRSRFIGDVADAAESARVPLPAFAQSVEGISTLATAIASGGFRVRQYATAVGATLVSEQALGGVLGVPIHNRARYISIFNATGAGIPGAVLLSQLSI